MSGNSMHAAFWAPYTFDNYLPIQWQPIPLNVLPANKDYVSKYQMLHNLHNLPCSSPQILYQAESKCPRYDQIFKKLITNPDQSSEFYAYNQRLGYLFQYLTANTGQVRMRRRLAERCITIFLNALCPHANRM